MQWIARLTLVFSALLLFTLPAELGFGSFIGLLHFGTLPHELTVTNMEMFAKEVMPELRGL